MTLEEIFESIDRKHIGVIGDFCLDVYWLADMKRSVLSREAPHYPLPVVEERMSPGGAGNVASNIAALKPRKVSAFGVTGMDWRGEVLRKCLSDAGVDIGGLIHDDARVTNAYIKPLRSGISDIVCEDPRLDFENDSLPCPVTERKLLDAVERADIDVLCVCDQTRFGCVTPSMRERLCAMGQEGLMVLADSRDHIGQYRHVIIKPNEVEAARALALEGSDYETIARQLSQHTGKPALITLGSKGCLVCEGGKVEEVPARNVQPPIDICGAGDTFLSALACALAAGAILKEAVWFANTASSITVRKLHTTGVATRDELRAAWA